jgi:hypothetical protein
VSAADGRGRLLVVLRERRDELTAQASSTFWNSAVGGDPAVRNAHPLGAAFSPLPRFTAATGTCPLTYCVILKNPL